MLENITLGQRYFIIVFSVLLSSIGHVLFKSAANTLKSLNSFWELTLEPTFIIGMSLYGITSVLWIWSLQEVPLSRAYLFLSLAYIFIPMLSWCFFGEVPNLKYLLSTTLILLGIACAIS